MSNGGRRWLWKERRGEGIGRNGGGQKKEGTSKGGGNEGESSGSGAPGDEGGGGVGRGEGGHLQSS